MTVVAAVLDEVVCLWTILNGSNTNSPHMLSLKKHVATYLESFDGLRDVCILWYGFALIRTVNKAMCQLSTLNKAMCQLSTLNKAMCQLSTFNKAMCQLGTYV